MKRIMIFLLMVLIGVAGLTASGGMETVMQNPGAPAVKKITPAQAYERMNSGKSVIVVDVRRADEYAAGHVPGAIFIPNEEIGSSVLEELPVLDAEILVYCRSGRRSAEAAEKLVKIGYTNVSDFGGIIDWPYETVAGSYDKQAKKGTFSSFRTWDINGKAIDEGLLSGSKVTMVNIWGTNCVFCIREMPALGQLAKDYKDKGLQIVGIVTDVAQRNGVFDRSKLKNAKDIVAQAGADYIHLLPSSDLIKAKLRSVYSIPETVFLDSNGNVIGQSYKGARSYDGWKAVIDSVLAEVN